MHCCHGFRCSVTSSVTHNIGVFKFPLISLCHKVENTVIIMLSLATDCRRFDWCKHYLYFGDFHVTRWITWNFLKFWQRHNEPFVKYEHLLSARAEKLAKIRSDSALPHPQPDSCPPTPTRLAGTGTAFEFEDRGDLIRFYNTVFVKRVKNFATKFSSQNTKEGVSVIRKFSVCVFVVSLYHNSALFTEFREVQWMMGICVRIVMIMCIKQCIS